MNRAALVLSMFGLGCATAMADEPAATVPAVTVSAAMRETCGDCHADGMSEGGFSLDDLDAGTYGDKTTDRWVAAWKNVRAETMPPPDYDRPSAEARKALLSWIEADVFAIDPSKPNPGHVPARRLNRSEYRHTVSDLLNVQIDTDEFFPTDDSSYGFDTVGDSLRMSPELLERFLAAAELAGKKAVPLHGPQLPEKTFWGGEWSDGKKSGEKSPLDEPRKLWWSHTPKTAGEYELVVNYEVYESWTFLPTTAEVVIRALPEKGEASELARRVVGWDDRSGTISGKVSLPEGKTTFELEIIPKHPHEPSDIPDVDPTLKYDLGVKDCALVGPTGAGLEYASPTNRIITEGLPPDDLDGRLEYARKIFTGLADEGFRRPARTEEIDSLVAIAKEAMTAEGGSFEAGIQAGVIRLLAMPQFLYRAESVPTEGLEPVHGAVPINEFALASRITYFLWAGPPDGGFRWAAKAGTLRKNLDEQIDRAIDDPWRRPRFVRAFVGQWLQTRDVHDHPVDLRRILGYRDPRVKKIERRGWNIREAMMKETEAHFEHLIVEGRPITELLDCDYAFLNEDLAKFYGVAGVKGSKMRKVDLPEGSRRGGLLTQGSFLLVTSNPRGRAL